MKRDSKQRPNKTARTRVSGTVSVTPASGSVAMPAPRKRRPSRIELKVAPAATRALNGKPAKAGKPPTKAPAATTRPRASALDAAAQVLAGLTGTEAKDGITTTDMIERMAKQKLWTSPGGKTPHSTLYAAMVREITAKGPAARFRKVSRGHFAAAAVGAISSKSAARQAGLAPAPGPRKRAQP